MRYFIRQDRKTIWAGYGLAVGLVAAGLALRWPLAEMLGVRAVYVFFFPAVVLGAHAGGLGPGLLATLLSTLAVYAWMSRAAGDGWFDLDDMVAQGVFLVTGILVSSLCESWRRAQRHVTAVLQDITDCYFCLNREGRFVAINPPAAVHLGLSPRQMLGRHVGDLFPLVFGTPLQEAFTQVLAEPYPIHLETPSPFRSGQWLEVFLYPEKKRVRVYYRDITARKAAEEALRLSEERFRIALLHSPITVFNQDLELRYTWIHNHVTDIPVEDILGKTDQELHNPEVLTTIKRQMLAEGTGRREEVTLRFGDQACVYDAYYEPLRDAAGQIVGLTGAAFDVTHHKRVEQELEEALQRLKYHVENSPLGVIEWDAQMRLTHWNREAEKMFGWRAAEVMGKGIHDFRWIYEEDFSRTAQVVATLTSGSDARIVCHNRNYRKDGSVIHCEWYNSALVDKSGKLLSVLSLVLDVTDHQRAEEELQQAKDAAEAASLAKDHFLAVLSHELRTPLNPVLAMISFLERDARLPREVLRDLSLARRNVELEARLIDDLLDLTRISRGKLVLEPKPVDANALVRQAIDICCVDAQHKHLQVRFVEEAAKPVVLGDGARLQQVFWNLLKNAMKFTPDNGQVTIRSSNDAAGRWVLEVQDTGVGIAAEHLTRIFDAFEQADQSVTHRFGGLGLGLAISKALVELHHGTITAASRGHNCGATFTVGLATVDAPPAPLRAVTIPTSTLLPGLRILLVEDHIDTVRVMVKLLVNMGYEVATAASLSDALAMAEEREFDLVLSDVGLPDGSGHDLMRQLRQRYAMVGIALSGFGMEEDVQRSREAGFAEHLIKPIQFEELQRAILRLGRRSAELLKR